MIRLDIRSGLFAIVLAAYMLAGILFTTNTPAWQAPDEPAHYNTIRQVAETGCCPRIEKGDWDSDYLQLLTSTKFAAEHLDRINSIQYEDHHPPLYYLAAAIVFRFSAGSLIALRLFSVLLGAITVLLSYIIAMRLAPQRPQIALAVMALVAFLPQHLAMMSAVNNDALAELIVAAGLLWIVRYLQGENMPIWQLGIIAGLALLCKITIYFLALIGLLAIILRWRASGRPLTLLIHELAIYGAIALVIGGPWWLRNISVYGFPDFLGLGAHDAVVSDQLRTADYIASNGLGAYLGQIVSVAFKSFWGQFGWMALPLDSALGGWIYRGFGLLSIASATGLVLNIRGGALTRTAQRIATTFIATVALTLLAFVYYNIEFVQWQGRYLFPALIPLALGLVVGLEAWRLKLLSSWAQSGWLLPLLMASLVALDLYLLHWVIVPGLSH